MGLGNLFGTGRRFEGAWERTDSDRSSLRLGYREPYLAGLPVAAEVSIAQRLEDSTWTADEARGVLDADLGWGWSGRLGVSTHRTVASGPASSRTNRVMTILGIAFDGRTEQGTRGRHGWLEISRGRFVRRPSLVSGEGTLVSLAMKGEENLPVGGVGHLRIGSEVGSIEGPDSLPKPDAIVLGGAASLRGYPERAFRALRYGLLRIETGIRILPGGRTGSTCSSTVC